MSKIIVTGAFGFSGTYITKRLLDAGYQVETLTNSPSKNNASLGITAKPLDFDKPDRLATSMQGASTLINTYWVRFNHDHFSHSVAVKNTFTLFSAAQKANIRRIIHISITNPDISSDLEYFRDKAKIEERLINSGVSYAILRPAVLFGHEDILINNIAWSLRKLPIFGVFGDGNYRIQPIYVDDLAELAVKQINSSDNSIIDAIGPETFTYKNLVRMIGQAIGYHRPIISVPPLLGYCAAWILGKLMNDVMMTWPEVKGLMRNLLCTDSKPTGHTKLSEWAKEHKKTLGIHYASELGKRKPSHQHAR